MARVEISCDNGVRGGREKTDVDGPGCDTLPLVQVDGSLCRGLSSGAGWLLGSFRVLVC